MLWTNRQEPGRCRQRRLPGSRAGGQAAEARPRHWPTCREIRGEETAGRSRCGCQAQGGRRRQGGLGPSTGSPAKSAEAGRCRGAEAGPGDGAEETGRGYLGEHQEPDRRRHRGFRCRGASRPSRGENGRGEESGGRTSRRQTQSGGRCRGCVGSSPAERTASADSGQRRRAETGRSRCAEEDRRDGPG